MFFKHITSVTDEVKCSSLSRISYQLRPLINLIIVFMEAVCYHYVVTNLSNPIEIEIPSVVLLFQKKISILFWEYCFSFRKDSYLCRILFYDKISRRHFNACGACIIHVTYPQFARNRFKKNISILDYKT